MNFRVRPADPGDAEGLVRLAEAVSAEPEAWLITTDGEWRSVGDERRYLKAVRRYPHAAVYVAEREEDGAIIGRLSLARDTHPASAHVADLGLMVAADARRQGVAGLLLLLIPAAQSGLVGDHAQTVRAFLQSLQFHFRVTAATPTRAAGSRESGRATRSRTRSHRSRSTRERARS